MKRILVLLSVSSALLPGGATVYAQDPKPAPITVLKEPGPVMYGRSAKIKATVEAIDLDAREVTLKTPRGHSVTMHVKERVKNLPQLEAGDKVIVRYNESVGLLLRRAEEGDPAAAEETVIQGTEPGEQSGIAASAQKTVVANVEAVNSKGKAVTLVGPQGNFIDLYVRDKAVLDSLEVGDKVVATYTEAVVVSIEGPKDKEASAKDAKAKKKQRKN